MRNFLVAMCLGFMVSNTAVAEVVLVQYAFTGTTLSPTTLHAGLTADAINTTGSTASVSTAGVAIADTMNYFPSATSAAAAVSNNSFFQFTITPNAGVTLDLSNLSFEVGKGGSASPRGYDLRSSLDAYATSISTAEVTQVTTPQSPIFQTFSIPLSGSDYLNVSSPVTFRLYGFVPSPGSQTLTFDSLTLSATSVPEPSAVIMSLAGVTTLILTGWRRSRSKIARPMARLPG